MDGLVKTRAGTRQWRRPRVHSRADAVGKHTVRRSWGVPINSRPVESLSAGSQASPREQADIEVQAADGQRAWRFRKTSMVFDHATFELVSQVGSNRARRDTKVVLQDKFGVVCPTTQLKLNHVSSLKAQVINHRNARGMNRSEKMKGIRVDALQKEWSTNHLELLFLDEADKRGRMDLTLILLAQEFFRTELWTDVIDVQGLVTQSLDPVEASERASQVDEMINTPVTVIQASARDQIGNMHRLSAKDQCRPQL